MQSDPGAQPAGEPEPLRAVQVPPKAVEPLPFASPGCLSPPKL